MAHRCVATEALDITICIPCLALAMGLWRYNCRPRSPLAAVSPQPAARQCSISRTVSVHFPRCVLFITHRQSLGQPQQADCIGGGQRVQWCNNNVNSPLTSRFQEPTAIASGSRCRRTASAAASTSTGMRVQAATTAATSAALTCRHATADVTACAGTIVLALDSHRLHAHCQPTDPARLPLLPKVCRCSPGGGAGRRPRQR